MRNRMIEDLDELVSSAVRELFGTMLRMAVQPAPVEPAALNGGPQVAGSVGFIGRLNGVVYFYTGAPFARQITATLLGMPETEVNTDEMVNDAMGEMTNMLVGHIKSRLADRGLVRALTIPSVVRGNHIQVQGISSSESRLFSFEAQGSRIFIDFQLKPTESSRTE